MVTDALSKNVTVIDTVIECNSRRCSVMEHNGHRHSAVECKGHRYYVGHSLCTSLVRSGIHRVLVLYCPTVLLKFSDAAVW